MTDKETASTKWVIGIALVLAMIMVGAGMQACSEASAAPNRMKEVSTARIVCSEISEDAGWVATPVTCGSGFSTIQLFNPLSSTNTVWIGSSTVTADNTTATGGMPLCSTNTACVGTSESMDTAVEQIWCTSAKGAATVDGGVPLKALCGW